MSGLTWLVGVALGSRSFPVLLTSVARKGSIFCLESASSEKLSVPYLGEAGVCIVPVFYVNEHDCNKDWHEYVLGLINNGRSFFVTSCLTLTSTLERGSWRCSLLSLGRILSSCLSGSKVFWRTFLCDVSPSPMSEDDFRFVADSLPNVPVELPRISAQDLQTTALSRLSSAHGLDAIPWSVARELPLRAWEVLAWVFRKIEQGDMWPSELLQVAMVPVPKKGVVGAPLPGTVRLVSIASRIYRIYSTTRVRWIQKNWLADFLPPEVCGGRCYSSTKNVLWANGPSLLPGMPLPLTLRVCALRILMHLVVSTALITKIFPPCPKSWSPNFFEDAICRLNEQQCRRVCLGMGGPWTCSQARRSSRVRFVLFVCLPMGGILDLFYQICGCCCWPINT